MHLSVHPTSQHICRACFRTLQQRRNRKNKVDDLENNLLRKYHEKAGERGLAIKTKSTAKRSLSFDKSYDPSTPFNERINCEREVTAGCFQPTSSSTPCSSTKLLDNCKHFNSIYK